MLGMCGYKDVCQIPKINYWLFKIYVGLVLAWIYKLKINYWFVDFKSGSYPCDVASRGFLAGFWIDNEYLCLYL